MNDIEFIEEIVKQAVMYRKENGSEEVSVQNFAQWMHKRHTNFEVTKINAESANMELSYQVSLNKEVQLSSLIGYLYKYAKHYAKKAFEGTQIRSLDDFSFLATLMTEVHITKSELIRRNLLEITSGTDILRRLILLNLVEEFDNEDDKRSKMVRISLTGRGLMISIFDRMHALSFLVAGNLSEEEKDLMVKLMSRLKLFHENIYQADFRTEIDQLIHKYISIHAES